MTLAIKYVDDILCRPRMALEDTISKKMKRRAVQLVEEAILISVALVVLSLVMGGIESVLNQVSQLTSSIWSSVSKAVEDLFGFLWKW